jgi:hypothetical protein
MSFTLARKQISKLEFDKLSADAVGALKNRVALNVGRMSRSPQTGQFNYVPMSLDDFMLGDLAAAVVAPAPTRGTKRKLREAAQLGDGLVKACSNIMAMPGRETTPIKRAARRIFTFACRQGGVGSRVAKKMCADACGSRRMKDPGLLSLSTPGRPKGSLSTSDKDLIELFTPVSVPSSKFGRKVGAPLRTLTKSIRRIYVKSTGMRAKLTYRQICRRVSNCKLGFAKGRRRTDTCDVCSAWTSTTSKTIMAKLNAAGTYLTDIQKNYFMAWDAFCAVRGFDKPDFSKTESPSYLKAFSDFINQQKAI